MNLANPAQHGTAGQNLGGATRLQEGIALALDGTEANLLDAQLSKQLLDNALAKEEAQLRYFMFQDCSFHWPESTPATDLVSLGRLAFSRPWNRLPTSYRCTLGVPWASL